MSERPLTIGLTGPIGCGKSTVAGMLRDLGAVVVDADAISRDATAAGTATLPGIHARFGDAVFTADGSLDRAALAAIVFEDAAALADLEAIVHPEVRRRVEDALTVAAESGALLVALEAIKLVEGGLATRCDEVWLVDCSPDVQRQRGLARGVAPDDLERRIAAQGADLAGRLESSATRRLSTDGDLASVREQVEDALAEALAPAMLGFMTAGREGHDRPGRP